MFYFMGNSAAGQSATEIVRKVFETGCGGENRIAIEIAIGIVFEYRFRPRFGCMHQPVGEVSGFLPIYGNVLI
jgi:hypothetical protein